ncbi:hypothetical protein Van01_09350 [Micromonospora andamanensis]|uniref:Uncharacterized protein n=2 Tax=Micromonospora andamanensis TaxID=1287068 RepID=A0ABQ4HQ11_9ACTN|nr:hypothetical protein Van01_09350 [Micromonospora andamanensis]
METDRNVPVMAHRTSSRLLFTAFGVSLLAGAGQLGLAFGFGIVRLTGTFTGASINQWPAQLVWAGWFATNAAVIGAVLTERLARPGGQLTGTARQLAVAGSAALGATVVAPLCMQPARSAELISVDPVWAVAICAGLGAVVGAGAALAVLVRPPLAWNMAAVAAVVWLLALLSVLPSLGATGPLTPVRLGVLEPAWLTAGTAQQLALLLLPMVTLLAGATTAAVARWRGHPPLVSGPSGVAGPVLVAFAYLAAGPGDPGDRYQLTPYYAALIAVVVGALGSAAAALLPWTATGWLTQRAAAPASRTAIEPTAILQPLPATPALPSSAGASADVPATADAPATADGSPPHWHWPIAHTDPSAVTTTPTASTAGARTEAVAVPAPQATAAQAAAPQAAPRQAAAPTIDAPVEDSERPRDDARSDDSERLGAVGQADGKPGATDPAPVGDGSDLPRTAPTTVETEASADPVGKTPTPRRTRTPRTPAQAPTRVPAPAPAPTSAPAAVPASAPAGAEAPVTVPAPEAVPSPGTAAAQDTPVIEPAPAGSAEADAVGAESPGATPRPRQFALPDLGRATAGSDAPTAAGIAATLPETPEVSIETSAAARDLSAAFTKPPAVRPEDVQPDGEPEKGRRGLFRRGRSRSGEGAATDQDEPLPAHDEEYVDWVAGLSRPLDDDEPTPPKEPRRSLRSTGRHHKR